MTDRVQKSLRGQMADPMAQRASVDAAILALKPVTDDLDARVGAVTGQAAANLDAIEEVGASAAVVAQSMMVVLPREYFTPQFQIDRSSPDKRV